MAVLQSAHSQEESERTAAATLGIRFEEEGMIARLLDSHPDLHTRLHHLQAHLDRK